MFDHFSRPLLPFAAVAFIAACAFAGSAQAESVKKQCSEKYQAAKTANTLAGQTWNQFYKQCAAELKAEPAAKEPPAEQKTAAPPPEKTATPPEPKKTAAPAEPMPTGNAVFPTAISPAHAKDSAGKARMETCLDQYKANKATNSNGGLKWIMKGGGYYSECIKRLKGGA
ncbi:MAG: hypothetical protein ACLPTZ_06975 [Beijerinckiaceae bacterium]